jgi:hypothetical protein
MNKYLTPGNGHQRANHDKAMNWFLVEFDGAEQVDSKRIKLGEKTYHATYSAEQKNIMLAGTKHGKNDDLPSFLAGVDGTLVLRQLKDGRLAGHRFEGARKLWDARDGMVAISWEKAGSLSDQVIVRRFDG